MIDGTNQDFASGSLEVYGKSPGMQVVSASGKRAYPGLAETYERTLWLVDASHSNHYILDVFKVAGGRQHDYVFRSYSGEEGEKFSLDLPSGVESVLQEGGSAAGQDVGFAEAPGLGYMRDVSVAACNGQWSANWRIGNEDETGIRLTMLGATGREILTAKGEGYGFFGQSPWDACVLARNKGGDSVFVSILEPYQGEPFVKSVEQLELAGAVGAKVSLEDQDDILLQRIESSGVCHGEVDGVSVAFDAQFVRVTTRENGAAELHLIDGSFLEFGEHRLDAPTSLRGEVVSADPVENSVVLHVSKGGMPESGDTIVFRNASYICNSSYEMTGGTPLAEGKCEVVFDMSLVLSEGSVAGVDIDSGVFSTQTCMTKLEVCLGLFDGKIIWTNGEALGALEMAGPNMEEFAEEANISGIQSDAQEPTKANFFKLASAGSVKGLKTGDRFTVCDLAAGDTFKVVRSAFRICDRN